MEKEDPDIMSNSSKGKGSTNKKCKPASGTQKSNKNFRRNQEIQGTVDRELKSQRNDFSWWNKFKMFTEYAGTIPFGLPLGNQVRIWQDGSGQNNFTLPGVMTLRFVPTVGYSGDKNSPINRSAIKWYSYMRMHQKASGDYNSQDQMIGLIALDSLFMFHAWIKRLLGIANHSDPLDRYTPEVLLMANGVDPDDVRDNTADYWGYINKLAADLAHFSMPKSFEIRVRHDWMCSGLYRDSDTIRAQYYMFVPAGFWQYDNTVTTGSQLTFTSLPIPTPGAKPTNLLTLSDIKAIGKSLLNNLLADEDIGDIMGDLEAAMGSSNMIHLEETARDYKVLSAYSEVVLSQIENSVCFPSAISNNVITQNPTVNNGAILYEPTFSNVIAATNVLFHRRPFINLHKEIPTVEDVIEATRLTAWYDGPYDSTNWKPTCYGTEILIGMYIWQLPTSGYYPDMIAPYGFSNILGISLEQDLSWNSRYFNILSQINAFDWHPSVVPFIISGTGEQQTITSFLPNVDFDTFAVFEGSQLQDMHEASLMSVLYLGE